MIQSQLGKLIIAILSLGVLMLLIVPMYTTLTAKATEDACRISVLGRYHTTFSSILTGGTVRLVPLTCSTDNKGTLEGNRESVKYQIAELMAKCWYQYAEGRVDNIYSDHDSKESICNVCYTFRIPNQLDLGGELYVLEEETPRTANISPQELIGYLMQTNYNKKVLYGGGTKTYLNAHTRWRYEFSFSDDSTLRYNQVTRTNQNPFVQDYAGFLSQETINKINQAGIELYDGTESELFIVTAQKFNAIDPTSARRLTEQLNLNSKDRFNSILIMVDMTEGIVRLSMGIELENYFLEGELEPFLNKHFGSVNSMQSFDDSMASFVEELKQRIVGSRSNALAEFGLTQRSYYNYITNRLQAPPPNILQIDSQRTYAITINSYKGENIDKWKGVWEAAAGGAAGGALACSWSGPGALICGVLGAAGAGFVNTLYNDYVAAQHAYNNSLMVVPLNTITGVCTTYD
jgi:hypothetical protein